MKRSVRIVAVALIMILAMGTMVSVAQARASDFIISASAGTKALGSGRVQGTGKIVADLVCSKIGIVSISIQEDRSGSWVTVTSASGKYTTGASSYSYSLSYSGTAGKRYRTVASFTATCDGTTETRSATSSATTAY